MKLDLKESGYGDSDCIKLIRNRIKKQIRICV
jgi:hypothetical protein